MGDRLALLRRTYGEEVACPDCGGRLRLNALVKKEETIQALLKAMHLLNQTTGPSEVEKPKPPDSPEGSFLILFKQRPGNSQVAEPPRVPITNEEPLSSNEELLTTIQELMATKEQMESANKASATLIDLLKRRNLELDGLNQAIVRLDFCRTGKHGRCRLRHHGYPTTSSSKPIPPEPSIFRRIRLPSPPQKTSPVRTRMPVLSGTAS